MSDPAWRATLEAAVAAHRTGSFAQAEAGYRAALALRPDHADSLHLLGMLCHQCGRDDEAIALLERAIVADPATAAFQNTLGLSLVRLQRTAEAETAFRRAVALDCDFAAALCNLGDALVRQGRSAEACEVLRRAVALDPRPEHQYNLGLALRALGDTGGALTAFGQAPGHVGALCQIADLHRRDGTLAAARAALDRAAALRPGDPQLAADFLALGGAFIATGALHEADEAYARATEIDPQDGSAWDRRLFYLHHRADISAADIRAAHDGFERAIGHPARAFWTPHANARDPARRLRIGYVSPDFRQHVCAQILMQVLAARDARQFEVFAYAEVAEPDAITARIRSMVDHWRPTVGESDAAVARTVRADGIDILVDLAGHTHGNRLAVLARKPAPVQVTWLGYPDTTGLTAIDAIIMDEATAPTGSEVLFSERVIRLPHGRFTYVPPAYAPPVRPAARRAGDAIVFGSFNHLLKLNERAVALWARVLHTVPRARLLLKWLTLDQPAARERVTTAFAAQGIAAERLDLRGGSGHRDMLDEYGDMDIALDPFPYAGGLTTLEALWMGLPVVTLPGERPVSRQGLAFLSALDLGWLVATTPDEYVAIAARLAGDPAARASLRTGLRERFLGSPLMDYGRFTRNLEAVYRASWQQWCEGRS